MGCVIESRKSSWKMTSTSRSLLSTCGHWVSRSDLEFVRAALPADAKALSQAKAGAVPFMKIPSALRSAERTVWLLGFSAKILLPWRFLLRLFTGPKELRAESESAGCTGDAAVICCSLQHGGDMVTFRSCCLLQERPQTVPTEPASGDAKLLMSEAGNLLCSAHWGTAVWTAQMSCFIGANQPYRSINYTVKVCDSNLFSALRHCRPSRTFGPLAEPGQFPFVRALFGLPLGHRNWTKFDLVDKYCNGQIKEILGRLSF